MLNFIKDLWTNLSNVFTIFFNVICIPIIKINSVVLILLILYSLYTINYELLLMSSLLLFIYVLFYIGVKDGPK